jgi:hypothetical protein
MYGQVYTNATTVTFPTLYNYLTNSIPVTGLPTTLDGTSIGLQQVEVTITGNTFTSIELFLITPNNRMIRLFSRLSGVTTLTGTFTFTMAPANPAIRYWTAVSPPPAAPFLPDVSLNTANDGTNPNGTWRLYGRGTGNSVTNFKLTFGTTNISPTKINDDCSGATPLINTRTSGGFVNGTNTGYGASLPNIDRGAYVCSGSQYSENTAWYTWVAACADDSLVIMTYGGVQTGIVKGNCGSALTLVQCFGQYVTYHTYKSLALTPGTRYYLVFDGDEALGVNYEIRYYPGACSLPIKLLYLNSEFNPATSLINVNWKTAMEINNKGFHLEARLVPAAAEFTEIGFIPSQNIASGSDYSYSFRPETPGFYEIRLIQEDLDGSITISPSTFVTTYNQSEPLKVYYNEDHTPMATYFLAEPEKIFYDLVNLNGIKIYSSSISGNPGNNNLDILLPLPPGVYFLQTHANATTSIKKIVLLK